MSILAWVVLGLVAGWLASVIVKPAGGSNGLLGNLVVGVLGAFVGGWLFQQFGAQGVTGFNLYSVLVAAVGAIVLLVLFRLLRRA